MQSDKSSLIRNCRHIMPTGANCQSPAMRDSAYCYYHARLHSHYPRPRKPKNLPKLENLDSRRAIQVAITEVLNGLLARKIDPRQAGRALYGIQMASQAVEGATAARLAGLANSTRRNMNPSPQRPCPKLTAPTQKPAGGLAALLHLAEQTIRD